MLIMNLHNLYNLPLKFSLTALFSARKLQTVFCAGLLTLGLMHAVKAQPLSEWTEAFTTGNTQGLGYGNELFVATTERRIYTRQSGAEFWSQRFNENFKGYNGVAYGNGNYVVVGTANPENTRYSSNGLTWTALPTSGDWVRLWAVIHADNKFVAVGQKWSVFTIEDPSAAEAAWTGRNSTLTWTSNFQAQNFYAIAWSGTRFVAVGNSGQSIHSTNGETWVAQVINSSVTFRGIAYGDGQFIAVGNDASSSRMYTSPDGITWTDHSSRISSVFGNNTIQGIEYGDGLWVIVGHNARLILSQNAVDWVLRDTGFTGNFLSVAYGDGQWQVGGVNRIFLSGTASNEPPSITDVTGAGVYDTGATVTLSAVVDGNPVPDVVWSLNGTPLEDGDGISGATTASLQIANVSLAQAGSYSLAATNPIGTTSVSIQVAVTLEANGARFTPLGIPTPRVMSNAARILADGSITGFASFENGAMTPFRFTDATAMQLLPHFGDAIDGSADGSVIVLETNGTPAYILDGSVETFPQFGGATFTGLKSVDQSGGIFVGGANLPELTQTAFRWTEADGFETLGSAINGRHPSFAIAITPDGTTIAGHLDGPSLQRRAFIWNAEDGAKELAQPAATFVGDLRRLSYNGIYATGFSLAPLARATIWTPDTAYLLSPLAELVPSHNRSDAWGISDSGITVGSSRPSVDIFSGRAAFWADGQTATDLQVWLQSTFSLSLPDWTLISAFDINASGNIITGIGENPSGQIEAWKLELPSPLLADFTSAIPSAILLNRWLEDSLTPDELTDPVLSSPFGILNAQGLSNLSAYVFGLDPHNPDVSRLPKMEPGNPQSPSSVKMIYHINNLASNYTLRIVGSADLSPDSWTIFEPPLSAITIEPFDDYSMVTVELPIDNASHFYRIELLP
jgi:hypothetical protein